MKNKILTIVVGTTVLLTSIVLVLVLGTPHAYAQAIIKLVIMMVVRVM